MAKPPETPPSSDINGVNQDARIGSTDKSHSDPGGAIEHARQESTAGPEQSKPSK